MLKWIKRFFIFLILILFLAIITPYMIHINTYKLDDSLPFKESSYKDINGIKIHFRKWTPSKDFINIKGKILMIHGLGGSTYSWRNNVEQLINDGYIVIAVDLPGFGYSDKRIGMDHSQKNRSKILWQLLNDIDLSFTNEIKDLDWILVGHSMGGGTVAAMAMENPHKTSSLILVSAALFDDEKNPYTKLLYRAPIRRAVDVYIYNYLLTEKKIGDLLLSAYGREPSNEEIQQYLNPLRINEIPSFIVDFINTAKSESIDKLKIVTIPILYISGENDEWVPMQQAMNLKDIVPSVEIITMENTAHCSMETNSDEFNKILLSFID